MKNHYTILLLLIAFAVAACTETSPVTSFIASQGKCYGVVRLAVEKVPTVENYSYQRKNPQTNQWEDIYWGYENAFDDTGYGLQGDKLLPGQTYEYRVRAHTDKGGYGDFSQIASGYIFAPNPAITKIEYKERLGYPGAFNIEYILTDRLPVDIQNLRNRTFMVYRAESFDMSVNNTVVLNIQLFENNTDTILAGTLEAYEFDGGKSYYYRVEAIYEYEFNVQGGGGFLVSAVGYYEHTSVVFAGGDVGGTVGEVNYTVNNYNEITGTASDAKSAVKLRVDGSNLYLGYLSNYVALGYGKPTIQIFNGTSWGNPIAMPSSIETTSDIDEFDFAAANDKVYIAARDGDDLFVFRYDGSWSENLATTILRGGGTCKYLAVEVSNNEIYVSVMHDDDVKLFKLDGNEWAQVGSTVATGFITQTKLRSIDGTLFIWYEEHVSGSPLTTLHIKSLEGTTWTNVVEWTKENAAGFDIAKAGGSIWFIDNFGKGGVYRVVSSANVVNVFAGVGSSHGSPQSITTDASGNIIISCLTADPDPANMKTELLLYDGSSWKRINDSFDETSIRNRTNAVQAINNNIHFVYGLKSSENESNIPTILKAKQYVK